MGATKVRRTGAMVAAVLAVGSLLATPSGAVGPTSSLTTITVGGDDVYEISSEDDRPCASTEIDIDPVGDATAGTWGLDGRIKVPFTFPADPGQTTYQLEVTTLSGTGPSPTGGIYTHIGGSDHQLTGALNVQAMVQTLDADDDCAKFNVCTVRARLVVDPQQSLHHGTLPVPTTGDSTDIMFTTELTGGIRPFAVNSCPVTIQGLIVNQMVEATVVLDW
jgi:hypothetical protein